MIADSVEKPAPPIIIRWVGPHSVTSWPKMRCQMSSSGKPVSAYRPQPGHQDAADRCVPGAGDAHGRRPRLVVRQHAGQAAGDEQQEQSEQDEVVRGVGQRSRVTALADVQADVPDEPEQRADQRRDEQCHRQRHPRRPLELASGPLGEVVQPGDAALPMQVADPQQPRGDDQGHRPTFRSPGRARRHRPRCPVRPTKPTLTCVKTPLSSHPRSVVGNELTRE